MSTQFARWTFASTLSAAAATVLTAQAGSNDAALIAKARAIHNRAITLDTHVDIDVRQFTSTCNLTMPLTAQVTLPRMIAGGLDAVFFIVAPAEVKTNEAGYGAAYSEARAMFDAIHELTDTIAPDQIQLARSPDEFLKIARSGKKVAMIGIEGGAPIGSNISRVREFYDRGARYMSLAHDANTQLADSHVGESRNDLPNHGLSDLGRAVIAEMNRVGMMVDLSHPSKDANLQAIGASRAPVIASHSAARALGDVDRNLDDQLLEAIRRNKGVVQVVAYPDFLRPPSPQFAAGRAAAASALFAWISGQLAGSAGNSPSMVAGQTSGPTAYTCPLETAVSLPGVNRGRERLPSEEARAEYDRRMAEFKEKWSPVPVTVKDLVDHIDYVVKKIGVDHVGVSSDFGGGGGVAGWNNAAETFNVTLELVRRGYSEKDIDKIWSGNFLRVWREADLVARAMQNSPKH